jgi:hypothetical protein
VIGNILAGVYADLAPAGDFESIATVTVGSGGTATITFSSIPSTYQHLQLRVFAQTNRSAATGDYLEIRFNSDTGSNYNGHLLGGNGTNAVAAVEGNLTYMIAERISCTTQTNIFGAVIMDILDYKSTNKNKTTRHLGGYDVNGDAQTNNIVLGSGLWINNTTAINSIAIEPAGGTLFNQYSHFALYGIKG